MKMILAVFVVLCFLLGSCSNPPPSSPKAATGPIVSGAHIKLPADSPQLARIQTITATNERVPQIELILPGKVEADPRRVSHIALPVTGRIREVLVNLGDRVGRGQPVLTVDSPDAATAMSAYRQAEGNVAQAKSVLTKAEADLVRIRDLEAHGAAAQKDVLAAEAVQVQSRAALSQTEAALEETLKRLEVLGIKPGPVVDKLVTVSATVSGKVIDISAVSGEYRSDTNTPFLTVADLSVVWIAADVPEDRIRFIQLGSTVSVTMTAYPGETFRARVARIGDTIDPQTRTFKVRAELANPTERFRPDMFAEIRLTHGSDNLPVIPRGALLETQGRKSVYIERGPGDFEEVPVTVSWQGPDRLAISQGVQAGDRVVSGGGMLLRGY